MARNDITLFLPGESYVPSIPMKTEAAATAILVGEPVQIGGTGNNFVIPMANGSPIVGTDVVAGIAASDSNHTASANGIIQVYLPSDSAVWACQATTPANMDTVAELTAILNDKVTFDLTGAIYTVDENEGDGSTHGLRIVGGDISTGTVYFVIRQSGTMLA
jgi:hypothetical protein